MNAIEDLLIYQRSHNGYVNIAVITIIRNIETEVLSKNSADPDETVPSDQDLH